MSDAMNRYAVELVRATRPGAQVAPAEVTNYLSYGASVRAATNLAMATRARALIHGRFHVIAEDVRSLTKPVLRHRLQLNYMAESDGIDVDEVVDAVIASVTGP